MDEKEILLQLQILQSFIRTVMTENCRCFDYNCDIKFTDEAMQNKIRHMISMFRVLQNKKACVTFFDKGRSDNGETINTHLKNFVKLNLLERVHIKKVNRRKQTREFYRFVTYDKKPLSWQNLQRDHKSDRCFCTPMQWLAPGFKFMFESMYKTSHYCNSKCIHNQNNENCIDQNPSGAYNGNTFASCGSFAKFMNSPNFELAIHEFTRCLFWYFRKAVVDNLIIYSWHRNSVLTRRPSVVPNLLERFDDVVDFTSSTESLYQQEGQWSNSNINEQSYLLTNVTEVGAGCFALSVGSTKISSDYDVTLYGSCVQNIITHFNEKFAYIFGDPSSTVFDTNIYGSSYIDIATEIDYLEENTKKHYKLVNCSEHPEFDIEPYWYLSFEDTPIEQLVEPIVQQHMWALIKLYKNVDTMLLEPDRSEADSKTWNLFRIKAIFRDLPFIWDIMKELLKLDDDDMIDAPPIFKSAISECPYYKRAISNSGYSPRSEQNENPLIRKSSRLSKMGMNARISESLDYSRASSGDVSKRVDSQETPFKRGKLGIDTSQNSLAERLNSISTIMFHGLETYFTRGAFLHVVFIQQTCNTKYSKVSIDIDAYLDSFIENFADFILHEKPKYLTRMRDALSRIDDSRYSHKILIGLSKNLEKQSSYRLEDINKIVDLSLALIAEIACERILGIAGDKIDFFKERLLHEVESVRTPSPKE